MIRLDGGVTGYGRAKVLHGVSFGVDAGQVLAVIGANGAGKTTLVSAIAGAVPLWNGTLTLHGIDVTRLGPEDRLQRGIALCPEGRRIFATLTVEENLRIGATVANADEGRSRRAEIGRRLESAYELFPILYERRANKGGQLSGGQQQMLAIARATMSRPTVLLLDEPSLGLSPVIINELYTLFDRLRGEGIALVLVEESARRALTYADHAIVLRNGAVVLEGQVEDVANDPLLAGAYIGAAATESTP